MKSFSHSLELFEGGLGLDYGNRKSEERPLILNCAGLYVADAPFFTDKKEGRKDYYLIYVAEGILTVFVDGKEKACPAGTAVIFPPEYGYSYKGGCNEGTVYYWVHFNGSFVNALLTSLGLPPPLVWQTEHKTRGKRLFNKLFDAFFPGDSMAPHRLAAVLYEILVFLCDSAVEVAAPNPLATSIRFINEHFDSDISVPYLAQMESLSVSRYNTLFRGVTGTGPNKYLQTVRINTACELLHSTDLSVREIAFRVGYNDPRFFIRTFKKTVGITPGQYRLNPSQSI